MNPWLKLAVRAAAVSATAAKKSVAFGIRHGAKRLVQAPESGRLPEGRRVELPGRGPVYVIDVPGPTPDAPVVVLLHALAATASLCFFTAFEELSRTHRVVTFDQRWHGRGIRSPRFTFADCADDTVAVLDELGIDRAVLAGYSMGGAIAQLVWKQHPERVDGLVLCSTARNLRGTRREQLFFPMLTAVMHPLSRYARVRVNRMADALPEGPELDLADPATWGRAELRSTSAWSLPEVLGELGRFNSADWIGEVDVPTAVVVTTKDHTIPARRQRKLADSIPGAVVHEFAGGHTSLFVKAKGWVPVFVGAVAEVTERVDDSRSTRQTG